MASLQEILAILTSGDASAKVPLLQALFKASNLSNPDAFVGVVTDLTKGADTAVRFWAKKVLARIGQQRNPGIQRERAQPGHQLEAVAASMPLELLVRKLETVDSTFVSIDVITKLCESRDAGILQVLIKYLGRCTDVVQISFLTKNLGVYFPSEALLPVLMPFLRHEDDRIVANTIEGIQAIGSSKGIVVFSQMLDHPSNRVRANAARALFEHDAEKTYEVLSRMLQLRDKPHFAISACHAIQQLQDSRYLPLLKDWVEEDLVSESALKAVQAIGGEEAVEALLSREENSEFVREMPATKVSVRLPPRMPDIVENPYQGEVAVERSRSQPVARNWDSPVSRPSAAQQKPLQTTSFMAKIFPKTEDIRLDCDSCKTREGMVGQKIYVHGIAIAVVGYILIGPSVIFAGIAFKAFAEAAIASLGGASFLAMVWGFVKGTFLMLVWGVPCLGFFWTGWAFSAKKNVFRCERCGCFKERM